MRIVIGIAVLLILASGSAVVFQSALESGGEQVHIENESWQPTTGEETELEESYLGVFYDDFVDVRDNDGNEMTAGEDYDWDVNNGTVTTLEGGDLDGETNAEIDYGYADPSERQHGNAELLSHIPTIIGMAIPMVAALILLGRFLG